MDSNVAVALTAVDPETGYIKAMVGGKDFSSNSFNLATRHDALWSSLRCSLLITALEEGISPYTSLTAPQK